MKVKLKLGGDSKKRKAMSANSQRRKRRDKLRKPIVPVEKLPTVSFESKDKAKPLPVEPEIVLVLCSKCGEVKSKQKGILCPDCAAIEAESLKIQLEEDVKNDIKDPKKKRVRQEEKVGKSQTKKWEGYRRGTKNAKQGKQIEASGGRIVRRSKKSRG
jgi:hypothetical protein